MSSKNFRFTCGAIKLCGHAEMNFGARAALWLEDTSLPFLITFCAYLMRRFGALCIHFEKPNKTATISFFQLAWQPLG
jgi:hypothetical protein